MTALRRLLATLRPADLFSLPVLLGAFLEFGLVQLASPYNARGHLALTALLQFLTVGVAFALLGVVYALLHGRVREQTLRVVLLVCLPIGALLGGMFLNWSRLALDLDATSVLPLRMVSTFMHVTAVTLLLWLAVSGIRLHYERLADLARERDRLEALDLETQHSLEALDVEATESVRTRILDGLNAADPDEPQTILVALTSTLDDIVRPLSRQLESQSEDWVPPTPQPTQPQRIDWKAAALAGMDPRLMSPFWTIVILNLFAVSMNFGRSGPLLGVEFILVSFCVAWPFYALVRRAVMSVGVGGAGRRITAYIVACILSGLGLAAAMLPFTLGGPQPLRFVYLAPIFTLLVAFVWGFAVAAQQQAEQTEAALRSVTLDLQWQIARSRELHRQRRRALAHAVHGQVQAALAAGILEIVGTVNAGTMTDARVIEVHRRVVDCVEHLDLRHEQPLPLDTLLAKVQATWAGLAELSLTVDPQLAASLAADSQCLTTLNDLIPELAFNSIKHGAATAIQITLRPLDERTVSLEVSDNGRSLTEEVTSGMGSRLLDEAAITWQRTRHEETTATTAILTFLPLGLTEQSNVRFRGKPLRVFP